MLYTKIQPQSILGSGKEIVLVFLPYMGMAAILFNCAKQFQEIVNIRSTEGSVLNLMKISQTITEKKAFKNNTILYMYIAQGQGQSTPRWQFFYSN